jgi:hypothetical protein
MFVMRRLFGILLLLGVAVVFLPARAADPELGVSPAVGFRGTLPGRTVEETVQVVNLSRRDLNVTGSLTDLQASENGTFRSASPGTGLPSAASWGTIEPASFALPQGHAQTVRLVFKVPQNVAAQGYYASAEFTGSNSTGASSISVHAVLLEIGGNGLIRSPKIAKLSAPGRVVGSTIPVTLRLENTGNVYAIAQGRIAVRDMFSRITSVAQIARTPVLPGTPRTIHVELATPVAPGRVRVIADLDFGSGVSDVSAATTVYAIAWWHIGVAVLLAFIVARLILAYVRHRRRRKAMGLTRKDRKERKRQERSAEMPLSQATTAARQLRAKKIEPPVTANPPPVPVKSDADLQSSWDAEPDLGVKPLVPEPESAPEPVRETPAASVPPPPTIADEELWPEPRVIPRAAVERPADDDEVSATIRRIADRLGAPPAAIEEPEPETEEQAPDDEHAAFRPPVIEDDVSVDEADLEEPEPEPLPVPLLPVEREAPPAPAEAVETEPEPVVEPEPIVAATPPPPEPVPAPKPIEEPIEEPAPAAARLARLSEQLLASIGEGTGGSAGASERRIKVAVDLLGGGSGKSDERIEVALKILNGAGADARAEVEKAFDSAAAPKTKGGLATMALALAKLDSPRAPEALLRAYAVAPRNQTAALKAAIRACDPKAVKAKRKLLDALPEDRRNALKLG